MLEIRWLVKKVNDYWYVIQCYISTSSKERVPMFSPAYFKELSSAHNYIKQQRL